MESAVNSINFSFCDSSFMVCFKLLVAEFFQGFEKLSFRLRTPTP